MKKVFVVLLILGILLRFYLQFLYPTFNVDEISLGKNIKELSFIELLYPLKYGQSSPPLYLLIQKIIISISPFELWFSFKILSFLSSVLSLHYFFKFIKKYNYPLEFLLVFLILIFNPYIVYNSLTLKQYSIDLLGVIILVSSYDSVKFKRNNHFFFLIWSLISNIGLFSLVGYLIFLFVNERKSWKLTAIPIFFRSNYKTIFSIIPYVLYYFWFIQQDGALALKAYMVEYWKESFLPLDQSFFSFFLILVHGFCVFFFSMNEILSIFLFLLASLSFSCFLLKKNTRKSVYFKEILLLLCIFIIHLILNVLHLYPMSDRLYLYLTIFFLLLLLPITKVFLAIKFLRKYAFLCVCGVSSLLVFSYKDYFLFKENDVVSLNEKIDVIKDKNVFFTSKAYVCVKEFNGFTENRFKSKREIKVLDTLKTSIFLVSRVSYKMKPFEKSAEEDVVKSLRNSNEVDLCYELKGYDIYRVKKK